MVWKLKFKINYLKSIEQNYMYIFFSYKTCTNIALRNNFSTFLSFFSFFNKGAKINEGFFLKKKKWPN